MDPVTIRGRIVTNAPRACLGVRCDHEDDVTIHTFWAWCRALAGDRFELVPSTTCLRFAFLMGAEAGILDRLAEVGVHLDAADRFEIQVPGVAPESFAEYVFPRHTETGRDAH